MNEASTHLKTNHMKLSDFIMLSAAGKKAMVLHLGTLIGKRQTTGGPVFLFQLEALYVEIYCHPDTNAIEAYHASTGTAQLSPYVDSIALDDLL